jgi:hypothetical protein
MWWQVGVSIFQTLIFAGSIWWLSPVNGSLYQLITLDSVYSTLDLLLPVILELLASTLTWKYLAQVAAKIRAMPTTFFLDRYLVYVSYIMLWWCLYILTYALDFRSLNLIGLVLPIPWIIQSIVSTDLFQRGRHQIMTLGQKLWRKLSYVIVASILNQMVLTIFGQHPQISSREIGTILEKTSYERIDEFIKTFIVTNIFQKVEQKHGFTRPLLKRLYNYGAIMETTIRARYEDPFSQIPDPREKIRTIVMKRRFEQFYNPHILMLLNKLYAERQGFDEFFDQQVTYWSQQTALFCTLYTVSSFFRHPGLLFPVALLFATDWTDIAIKAVGGVIGIMWPNYFGGIGGAFVCSYGTPILINRITEWCWQQLRKKYHKYQWLICHNQEYTREIVVAAGSLILISRYFSVLPGRCIILFELLSMQHPWILAWLTVVGALSEYAIGHVIILALSLYLGLNLTDYSQIPPEVMAPNLIVSYRVEKIPPEPSRSQEPPMPEPSRSLPPRSPSPQPLRQVSPQVDILGQYLQENYVRVPQRDFHSSPSSPSSPSSRGPQGRRAIRIYDNYIPGK